MLLLLVKVKEFDLELLKEKGSVEDEWCRSLFCCLNCCKMSSRLSAVGEAW